MIVRFKKMHPDAVTPAKAHPTDAGFDLTTVEWKFDDDGNVVYDTGIAVEIPEGYVGLAFPRSSVAKMDLILSNCVGVIDSHYRGSIKAKFKPIEPLKHIDYHFYKKGDRICQLVIIPIPDVMLSEAEELSETDRGAGGYGSSGQ